MARIATFCMRHFLLQLHRATPHHTTDLLEWALETKGCFRSSVQEVGDIGPQYTNVVAVNICTKLSSKIKLFGEFL